MIICLVIDICVKLLNVKNEEKEAGRAGVKHHLSAIPGTAAGHIQKAYCHDLLPALQEGRRRRSGKTAGCTDGNVMVICSG
jgi:hypothetical protein